jgi:hypothetical protein
MVLVVKENVMNKSLIYGSLIYLLGKYSKVGWEYVWHLLPWDGWMLFRIS